MRKPQDVYPEGVKIIHRVEGRIYGLDLGEAYDDPGGDRVGEKHKHRWDEQTGMKEACAPQDGIRSANQPSGEANQLYILSLREAIQKAPIGFM